MDSLSWEYDSYCILCRDVSGQNIEKLKIYKYIIIKNIRILVTLYVHTIFSYGNNNK